jgi:branched-chain amino acid transport system permease protein
VRSVDAPYVHETFEFAAITLAYGRVIVFAIAIALTLALDGFLNHSRFGRAIKATSFDRDAARLSGIDVQVYAVTFAIGAMMAGIAGSLVAVVYSFSPVVGDAFTMKAFVVVVLGGLGSVPGTILAGIALGVVENLASLLLDPGYRDVVGFGLLLLVLLTRPQGLLGKLFFAEVKG